MRRNDACRRSTTLGDLDLDPVPVIARAPSPSASTTTAATSALGAGAKGKKGKKEEAALFKPVQTQKVPFGVDPKTVLCAFYKAGTCEKGAKCKFSHDKDIERKVEKRNLSEDSREGKMAGACSVLFVGAGKGGEVEGRDRHDGNLGRGEAPDGGLVEEREPSDNHGCE